MHQKKLGECKSLHVRRNLELSPDDGSTFTHSSFRRMVDRFDGQLIWIQNEPCYELGNYLGGGASGFVH